MGSAKRQQRSSRAPQQMRSRTTRSKGKLLSDPAQNTQDLHQQLRAMGLYAANTLGDGNCLFRALSDQSYGTEAYHLQLRQQVCNWLENHKDRYAPFCEDERGLDTHLQCMRQPATYGGHMELSAFAHMTRRDVKVVQPGLVYVIEWAAGGDPAPPEPGPSSEPDTSLDESTLDARERRRLAREKKREVKEKKHKERQQEAEEVDEEEEGDEHATVYVAYYDWEHFSSIRNLRGPHTGLPRVREAPPPDDDSMPLPTTPSKKKPAPKAKLKAHTPKSPSKRKSVASAVPAHLTPSNTPTSAPSMPSQIPLPPSRSPSPMLSSVPPSSQASFASDALPRHRSPKRSFDESSAGSSQSSEKRVRMELEIDDGGEDEDTPALSASGFSTESSASSPAPTPPPYAKPAPAVPALTRRERKKLGLPKPRVGVVTRSAGKIVVPGGRYRKNAAAAPPAPVAEVKVDEEDGEWRKNGTGRVDVRGFRELKI